MEFTGKLGPFQAFLFDMDGTILTSIAAVDRAWRAWARRIGTDEEAVMAYMHGRRARDTISHFMVGAPDAAIDAEADWLEAFELSDIGGIEPIPGIQAVLEAAKGRWALVTSATPGIARARVKAAGLSLPEVVVTSADVTRGKPDPMGYLMAAKAMGVDPAACLVFEDAHAGIAAGQAAGATVMQILGTEAPQAEHGIRDYSGVSVTFDGGLWFQR
ncbi:HAD-IA family hydrolase [Stagnihabitans tardus]|uniref:HAD-IA family hydrolase n=1 Tax=Stagnihabitans tardus TaxID=2699202 RepID=A0AAE4YCM7_9RHOB|nr:HAD-IA family hydrolase [Stagnihabitans tardus]NBZ87195.1 HAD-IA family hydrolase [Stagnihabitans tardus]